MGTAVVVLLFAEPLPRRLIYRAEFFSCLCLVVLHRVFLPHQVLYFAEIVSSSLSSPSRRGCLVEFSLCSHHSLENSVAVLAS